MRLLMLILTEFCRILKQIFGHINKIRFEPPKNLKDFLAGELTMISVNMIVKTNLDFGRQWSAKDRSIKQGRVLSIDEYGMATVKVDRTIRLVNISWLEPFYPNLDNDITKNKLDSSNFLEGS